MEVDRASLHHAIAGLLAHAALADDTAHLVGIHDIGFVGFFANACRRPRRHKGPGAVLVFLHHRPAMVDHHVLENGLQPLWLLLFHVFVADIARQHELAVEQHLVAHFQFAGLFFGDGCGETDHGRASS